MNMRTKQFVLYEVPVYSIQGASLVAQLQCMRPQFNSWVGKIAWRGDRVPTPVFLGFPCVSNGKESTCNVGDLGLILGLERSPGRGHGNHSSTPAWRILMDREAWGATVHGVTKSWTRLSD